MTEHQIITFHREDLIQALEDYYEKIHQFLRILYELVYGLSMFLC